MTKRSSRILRFVLLLLLLVSFVLNFMAASVSAAPVVGNMVFYPYINPYFTYFDSDNDISFNLYEPFAYDKIFQSMSSSDYYDGSAAMRVTNFDYHTSFVDSLADFHRFSSLYVLDGLNSPSSFNVQIRDFYLFDIITDDFSSSYNGFRCHFLESVPALGPSTEITDRWYNRLDYIDVGGFDVYIEYYMLGSSELRTYSYNTEDLLGYWSLSPGGFFVSYEYLPEFINHHPDYDDSVNITDYFYPIEGTDLFYNGVYVKYMSIYPDSNLSNYVLSDSSLDFCLLVDTYDLVNYPDFVIRDVDVYRAGEELLINDGVFKDYTKWMGTAVDGFLQLEIAPNFSLGGIFLVLISSMLALFFLKLFAGG